MRIIVASVLALAGAAALLVARPDGARAAEPSGAAPVAVASGAVDTAPAPAGMVGPRAGVPGTDAEERDYALREAESPENGEFVGGDCGFAWFVLFAAVVVVLILFLKKEEKI